MPIPLRQEINEKTIIMKKTILKVKALTVVALSLTALISATSCDRKGCMNPLATNYEEKAKEEDPDSPCEFAEGELTKSGVITADETWYSYNIYFLKGKVIVPDGVTLTIEAGTIIKGKEGIESDASALVVARGGKINAIGTADKPIIFTSEFDDITYGQLAGTNLSSTDNEKWGGIIILGKAPVSTENGDTEGNIEGLPADEDYAKYGGTVADDNSGTLSYVSIRHGGVTIGEGNEINGLTLGGVGNGTTINNIEIYATLDDGIEFFGGTVNASNILIYNQGDDGIDIDQNYSGTVSEFIVMMGDGVATDEGLEIDGPEGSTYTDGKFTLQNGICKSFGTTDGSAADFKAKAQGNVNNVTFDYSSIGNKKVKIRASYNSDCTNKSDALSYLLNGTLKFTNSNFTGISVYENATTPVCGTQNDDNQSAAEGVVNGNGAGGSVSTSGFSWTCAGNRNEL